MVGFDSLGFLPPFTFVPATGPTAVPETAPIAIPAIPPPINSGRGHGVHPAVPVGGGYISRLGDRVKSMDVVRGMDRVLGKTTSITLGKRAAQSAKILQNFSAVKALGDLVGRWPLRQYGRMLDTVA